MVASHSPPASVRDVVPNDALEHCQWFARGIKPRKEIRGVTSLPQADDLGHERTCLILPVTDKGVLGIRRRGVVTQVLKSDVSPANLLGRRIGGRMDLERDKPIGRHRVDHPRSGNTVDPGAEGIPVRFDAQMVPASTMIGAAGRFVSAQVAKPTPPRLIVDASAPRPRSYPRRLCCPCIAKVGRVLNVRLPPGRIDFHLVTMNAPVPVIRPTLTANLDARIEPFIRHEFELENEVSIVAARAEKTVGCALPRRSDNHALFNHEGSGAVPLNPAIETVAVEKIDPRRLVRSQGTNAEEDQQEVRNSHD